MKELKDQVIDVIKSYKRLTKKMEHIEEISHGEVDFGFMNTRKEIQIYQGVEKVAEMLGLTYKEEDSGSDQYPIMRSVWVEDINVYEVE